MNPHLVRAVLVTALCCASQPTLAQETASERPVSFGFMFGPAPLAGAAFDGSDFGPGYAVAIAATFPLPSTHLAIRADLMYRGSLTGSCPINVLTPAGGTAVGDTCIGPSQAMPLSVDLIARLNPRSVRWSPYLVVGGAAYVLVPSLGAAYSHPRGGLQGGAGFEYRFTQHAAWFVEGRFMGYEPGGMVPVTFGMRF